MPDAIAILGGGGAGLSADHELIERGFQVEVFEGKPTPGGKARSIPVTGSGTGGRRDLPGEHGFRFFPGFYKHITDTMRRIPYGASGNAFDNLFRDAFELPRVCRHQRVLADGVDQAGNTARIAMDGSNGFLRKNESRLRAARQLQPALDVSLGFVQISEARWERNAMRCLSWRK